MHTIKPLDTALLAGLADKCKAIVTVEEHSVYGGLGEACASWLLQNNYHKPFKIIGIPDEYTVTVRSRIYLIIMELVKKGLADVVLSLLNN